MSTPAGFLLGIVKATAKRTDHALPPHLTPLAEGREVTAFADLEQALENPGQRLTDDQRACLFANITEKLAGFNNRQKRCFGRTPSPSCLLTACGRGPSRSSWNLPPSGC